MPNRSLVLMAICSLAFIWGQCCSPAKATPAKKSASELVLKQSSDGNGHFITYVANDAVKLSCPESGYEILCKAPSWNVYCFRRDENLVYMTKLSEFNGVMMHNPFAKRDSKKSMVTSTSKGYFHGLPCTVYKYGDTKRTTADDSTVTPQVAEFICRFFVTPVIPKIPLDIKVFRSQASRDFYDSQIKQQSTKNKLIPWLNMPEISNFVTERSGLENRLSTLERKEVPYNANDFECPPGLQRVSQPQQVVFSRKNKEDLRDLLNDIGFASEPAEAGKQSKGKAQGEK